MAGRGRGRGSNISFNIEALGISKGECLTTSTVQQPPPHFPPRQYKAVPIIENEEENYLLELKQEFRRAIRDLPYYYIPEEEKKDIERYSDKYQNGNHDPNDDWQPDWSYMPEELKVRRVTKKSAVPKIKKVVDTVTVAQTFEKLEEKEQKEQQEKGEGEGSESDEKDEEEMIEEEVYDEEEMEEETDYIMSYFDNGEAMDDEDDNLDDGPTYS